MLSLPKVTLFAIDCVTPNRTLMAMRYTARWMNWGRIVLLTDKTRNYDPQPQFPGLEIYHLSETDKKVSPFPGHPPISVDYDRDVMTRTIDYCDRTPYLLHMEWDSAVLNPSAWTPGWLKYDFIAPPWPAHTDPGWPACDGETNSVGSFGFCLGSAFFWRACKAAYQHFSAIPRMAAQTVSSDRFICRTARPYLEDAGVRFAPHGEAMRFGCENRIYSGEFGYHGKGTIALNGWQIPMK